MQCWLDVTYKVPVTNNLKKEDIDKNKYHFSLTLIYNKIWHMINYAFTYHLLLLERSDMVCDNKTLAM